MTSVDWGIESTPGGYPDSFTAPTTQTFLFPETTFGGFDVDQETIALSGTYAPGTYYLTLQNGVTSNGDPIYWDINNGPSVAYENSIGNVDNYLFSGSNSTAFAINGTTATPEPSSLLLLGSGLAGMVGMIRRRVKA